MLLVPLVGSGDDPANTDSLQSESKRTHFYWIAKIITDCLHTVNTKLQRNFSICHNDL